MRIADGKNPLDATSVHPESYKAAEALLDKLGLDKKDIIGGSKEDIELKICQLYAEKEKPKKPEVRKKGLAALADIKTEPENPKKNLGKAIEKMAAELEIGSLTLKDIIEEIKKPEPPKEEENKIFTAVEQKPQFPGGEAALMKWLSSNIQYPVMAQEEGAQGRVVVQFVVEKDGRVGQAKIARGRHPELDKEAIRLVKSLPKFIPGKNNGQSVRCWFTLPINFKLQQ
jgi:protein TonB